MVRHLLLWLFRHLCFQGIFPNSDPTISLLLTFGTFGLAYLIRPVGGVVLGAHADRHGRMASLMVSRRPAPPG